MKKIEIDRKQLLKSLRAGVPKVTIAKNMGISKHTLHRYLKKQPVTDTEMSGEQKATVEPKQQITASTPTPINRNVEQKSGGIFDDLMNDLTPEQE